VILKNLSKIYYVMVCVKRPFSVLLFLLKYRTNPLYYMDITFKNNVKIENTTPGMAWSLITYYYWAGKLHLFSDEDIRDLASTGSEISKKLVENLGTNTGYFRSIQGKDALLYMLIRTYRPEICVETGISAGFSTYYILKALEKNGSGTLISIDIKDEVTMSNKKFMAGWLVPDNLKNRWQKVIESSDIALTAISLKIDFFVHDSMHSEEYMLREYLWAMEHLNINGILASDDIDWNDAWKKFIRQHNNFKEMIKTPTFGVAIKKYN
jgi:predicted O-methyltransferase YrrM